MKYKIQYSHFAEDDVREIKKYLSQFYPSTKNNFLDELKRRIDFIRTNPSSYEVCDSNPAYRKMLVLEYVVFYRVDEDEKIVLLYRLYRVLHGKRDVIRYL